MHYVQDIHRDLFSVDLCTVIKVIYSYSNLRCPIQKLIKITKRIIKRRHENINRIFHQSVRVTRKVE